ncbi:hypothetical protein [Pseudorhodobacter ferrugineus]|uniref:hypothetical protein n=1 Tax=Pseudorhodobacter ferrugineus TaxID=77008 RepID=UPI0003B6DFC2|nr:hypothetical protein [Pseudorhodobacter ferrugineus]
MASHMSYALRLAMIFHETRRLEGGTLPINIGAPLSAASLQTFQTDIAQALRRITMALAAEANHTLDEAFVWPRRVRV